MKNNNLEKQASSEIAQSRPIDESRKRFMDAWRKSGYADMSTWREISWDLYQAAERDTRERCAQIVKLEDLNWDYRDIDPGEAVSIFADNVIERIRGKE